MTIFLVSEVEQKVIDAEAQISLNCHFPNHRGTDRWANVFYDEDKLVFYIPKPPVSGWNDSVEKFTQAEMMANVIEGDSGVREVDWE